MHTTTSQRSAFLILAVLRRDGDLSPRDISQRTGIKPRQTAALLDTLLRQGYVCRYPSGHYWVQLPTLSVDPWRRRQLQLAERSLAPLPKPRTHILRRLALALLPR